MSQEGLYQINAGQIGLLAWRNWDYFHKSLKTKPKTFEKIFKHHSKFVYLLRYCFYRITFCGKKVILYVLNQDYSSIYSASLSAVRIFCIKFLPQSSGTQIDMNDDIKIKINEKTMLMESKLKTPMTLLHFSSSTIQAKKLLRLSRKTVVPLIFVNGKFTETKSCTKWQQVSLKLLFQASFYFQFPYQ